MPAPAKRDLVGYANRRFDFTWPGGKRLALAIVVNFEEGSEHSVATDGIIEEVGEFGPVDIPIRDIGNESCYEYGSRVGVWRILDTLEKYGARATFAATAQALDANRVATKAIVEAGHEVCDHGLRWTENWRFGYDEEKRMIEESVLLIEELTGRKPVGFQTRGPSENTVRILRELGNFVYDSDYFNDDLPYRHKETGMLILPYTPDVNDFNFQAPMYEFSNADEFFAYAKDAFDLYAEEARRSPKMMSIGLHCRVVGRPARMAALRRFLEHVGGSEDVWVATREEIANHWVEEVEGKNKV